MYLKSHLKIQKFEYVNYFFTDPSKASEFKSVSESIPAINSQKCALYLKL